MQTSVAVTYRALIDVHFSVRVDLQRFERIHRDQHRSDVGLIKIVKKNILLPNWEWTYQLGTIEGRDVVLEASASSRGGLEAVFFKLGRPRLGLTWSCLGLDLTVSASALPHSFCLGLRSVCYLIYFL